ncbi:MAG: hypothetical protein KA191_05565 [Verrucomicrobia bacterium]|jgi:hypothetical protein|nr:hypothetical protein [Verrucomicrobiota bacterium]OQC63758.1 MAG: hypothetical protein BWX48_03065 [Verrucomicrobia bacterium ADurb.Bin006]MDI9381780.1 hypothetical protein [Verrucomicrobiota bacterium]NMD21839.1 hypothetical protein [Verrucomicrobiota bacterium]HNU99623.1 hypothetical protein [Verrucomicrobiota bacterium]
MKSAYELAMERLNRDSPIKKLSDAQKTKLAELDSIYAAKIAEREIALTNDIRAAEIKGDIEAAEQARRILAAERAKLQAELETQKDRIRAQD